MINIALAEILIGGSYTQLTGTGWAASSYVMWPIPHGLQVYRHSALAGYVDIIKNIPGHGMRWIALHTAATSRLAQRGRWNTGASWPCSAHHRSNRRGPSSVPDVNAPIIPTDDTTPETTLLSFWKKLEPRLFVETSCYMYIMKLTLFSFTSVRISCSHRIDPCGLQVIPSTETPSEN